MELLKSSPQKVEKILVAKKTHLPAEFLSLLENLKAPLIHVEREKLDRIVGFGQHQGVVAVCREISFSSPNEILEDVIKKRGVMLVLDHVKDPQNLGNIVRSSEAFGVSGVIIPALRASGFTEAVAKASVGALFNIKVAVVKNLANFLRSLKEKGVWIFALERGGKSLYDSVFSFPMALVVGSEDEGVSPNILKLSDEIVSIPMVGKINSLNVASSVAIALSWILDKRGG